MWKSTTRRSFFEMICSRSFLLFENISHNLSLSNLICCSVVCIVIIVKVYCFMELLCSTLIVVGKILLFYITLRNWWTIFLRFWFLYLMNHNFLRTEKIWIFHNLRRIKTLFFSRILSTNFLLILDYHILPFI